MLDELTAGPEGADPFDGLDLALAELRARGERLAWRLEAFPGRVADRAVLAELVVRYTVRFGEPAPEYVFSSDELAVKVTLTREELHAALERVAGAVSRDRRADRRTRAFARGVAQRARTIAGPLSTSAVGGTRSRERRPQRRRRSSALSRRAAARAPGRPGGEEDGDDGDPPLTSAHESAVAFLRRELAAGPMPAAELRERAKAAGLSWRSIERAKRDVGAVSERVGGLGRAGSWSWRIAKAASVDPPRVLTPELRAYIRSERDRLKRIEIEDQLARDRLLFRGAA